MPVVSDYTALLAINDSSKARWNNIAELGTPVIVTYSFADGDNVPTVNESSYTVSSTSAFTNAQRENFRDAAQAFEDAAGIIFVEVEEGGMIDISNADGSSYGGWASYPWVDEYSTSKGIFVIDNSGDYDEGSYAFQTLLHELGHSLGLQHPHDGSLTLSAELDNQNQTVMTYNNSFPYTSVLGTLDFQALKHLYGSSVNTNGWKIKYKEGGEYLLVEGNGSANTIMGVAGDNKLYGKGGKDVLYGREDEDVLKGGSNDDKLFGGYGDDKLFGGKGGDKLDAGFGNDTVNGEGGSDRLFGEGGADMLFGGDKSDKLYGGAFGDGLYGGDGNDTIFTGSGYGDSAYGGKGDDKIIATEKDGSGDFSGKILTGGAGSDSIEGHNGGDTITGGRGEDILAGNGGFDVFVFDTNSGKDFIRDFADGVDRIKFTDSSITFDDLSFKSLNGGSNTLIRVADTSVEIKLKDVEKTLLSIADFEFA